MTGDTPAERGHQYRFETQETEVGTFVQVYDESYAEDEPAMGIMEEPLRELGTRIVDEFGRVEDGE